MTNLTLLRKQMGLSQQELAALIGIPRPQISLLENGWYRRCPRKVESKLRDVFGADWDFEKLMQAPPTPKPEIQRRAGSRKSAEAIEPKCRSLS